MWRSIAVFVAVMLIPYVVAGVPPHRVLYGFIAFPYDMSLAAIEKVHEIILPASNFFPIHYGIGSGECVPWNEALAGRPFPEAVQQEWDDIRRRIPRDRVVYVGIGPTPADFRTVAPACDGNGQKGPGPWRDRLDHPDVIRAYGNYVKRVVEFFRPRYINIGIEMSELSLRHPEEWPRYATLFVRTYDRIKGEYPDLVIGMEFTLQSLMLPRVAEQVKPVVEKSDYLGLSFYPYGSSYGIWHGAPALPEGLDQWRKPLEQVRQYTTKPIAVCETGYITQDAQLPTSGIRLPGDLDRQTLFVRDLVAIANRDRYLFVVWFVPVDYDRLYEKLPSRTEAQLMWMHAGLFDKDLRPKPAWAAWQEFARVTPETAVLLPAGPATAAGATVAGGKRVPIRFDSAGDLFTCRPGRVELDRQVKTEAGPSMRWRFEHGQEWAWCSREFPAGQLAGVEALRVRLQSDPQGFIAVRLDDADGASFLAVSWVPREWREDTLKLAAFGRITGSTGSGPVRPERIVRMVLADGSGPEDGARGERTLWVSGLTFE